LVAYGPGAIHAEPQVLRLRLAHAPTFAQHDICFFLYGFVTVQAKAGALALAHFCQNRADMGHAAPAMRQPSLSMTFLYSHGFVRGWAKSGRSRAIPLLPKPGRNGAPIAFPYFAAAARAFDLVQAR